MESSYKTLKMQSVDAFFCFYSDQAVEQLVALPMI